MDFKQERRERIGLQEAPLLGTVVTFNKNFAPAGLHIVFSQTTSVAPSTKERMFTLQSSLDIHGVIAGQVPT